MSRKKKSSIDGALGIAGVGLVILVAIPKEVWIVVGVLIVFGLAVYLYAKHKNSADSPQTRESEQFIRQSLRPSSQMPAPLSGYRPQPGSTARTSTDELPISVVSKQSKPSDYRVPAAPKGYGQAVWIHSGQTVSIGGVTVAGGMLYVGTALKTLYGGNDPCLIDPSKTVALRGDYTERQTNYWPSYSEISASARRAYLNWLSEGRNHPEADIGYVFLYFYGLERRAVIDAADDPAAQADRPAITQELKRLLSIYGGKSNSFRRYAGDLLNWVELADHPSKLYEQPAPEFSRTWELPLYLKLAFGQAAVDGVPVPAHLALAWARFDPNIHLRTPATRCPEQFARLFELKYADAFGVGIVLPKNKTKLKFVYRPASAGFRGCEEIKLTFGDTPDVSVLTGPVNKLQQAVEAATKELDAYSRYLGRSPGANASLEGLLQLPATLWPESAQNVLRSLKARMGQGMIAVSFQELLSMLEAKSTPTKDKVLGLARALESMNIAMEPDVLGGAKAPRPEDKVVLFAVPPGEPLIRNSPAYQAALLTLQLSSAVAMADGDFSAQEMSHLRTQVQSWTHLTPSHHRRLLAHLRLLVVAPVSLASLKKKLEPLDASAKEAIAAFMPTVAQSDGTVSPAEVKMLEKVYRALGVDPKKVFSDVHAAASGTAPAILAGKAADTRFKLDPARIAALQQDTEMVSTLLANIFTEDEPRTLLVPAPVESDDTDGTQNLMGLDGAHSALARMLLSRPKWSRQELLDVAADLDLMLDGALEHINEASFEANNIPFTEGDDPIEVNTEALEKIEA